MPGLRVTLRRASMLLRPSRMRRPRRQTPRAERLIAPRKILPTPSLVDHFSGVRAHNGRLALALLLTACGGSERALESPVERAVARNAVVVQIDGLDSALLEAHLRRVVGAEAESALARWSSVESATAPTLTLRTAALLDATLPLPGLPDPSAAALLTGQGPSQTGVLDANDWLPEGTTTLTSVVPRSVALGFPQGEGEQDNDAIRLERAQQAVDASKGDPPRLLMLRLSGVGDALMSRGPDAALRALADVDKRLAQLLSARFDPERTLLVVTSGFASAPAAGPIAAMAPGETTRKLQLKPEQVSATGGLLRLSTLAPDRAAWLATQPATSMLLRRAPSGFELFDIDLGRTRPLSPGEDDAVLGALSARRLADWVPQGEWVAVADRARAQEFRRVGEDPPRRFAGGLTPGESRVPLLFAGPVSPLAPTSDGDSVAFSLEDVAPTVAVLLSVRLPESSPLAGRGELAARLNWAPGLPPARLGEAPGVFFDHGLTATAAAARAVMGDAVTVRERRYNEALPLTAETATTLAERELVVVWGQPPRALAVTRALAGAGGPAALETSLDGLAAEVAARRVAALVAVSRADRALEGGAPGAVALAALPAAEALPPELAAWPSALRGLAALGGSGTLGSAPGALPPDSVADAPWSRAITALSQRMASQAPAVGESPFAARTGWEDTPVTPVGAAARTLWAEADRGPCPAGEARAAVSRAGLLRDAAKVADAEGASLVAAYALRAAFELDPKPSDGAALIAALSKRGVGVARGGWAGALADSGGPLTPAERAAFAGLALRALKAESLALRRAGALTPQSAGALLDRVPLTWVRLAADDARALVTALAEGRPDVRTALAERLLSPRRLVVESGLNAPAEGARWMPLRALTDALDLARPGTTAPEDPSNDLLWGMSNALRVLDVWGTAERAEALAGVIGPEEALAARPLSSLAAQARARGDATVVRWGPLVHATLRGLRAVDALANSDVEALRGHAAGVVDVLGAWARAEAEVAGAGPANDARLVASVAAAKAAVEALLARDADAAATALGGFDLRLDASSPTAVRWTVLLGVTLADLTYVLGRGESKAAEGVLAAADTAVEGFVAASPDGVPALAGALLRLGQAGLRGARDDDGLALSAWARSALAHQGGQTLAHALAPFITALASGPKAGVDALLAEQLPLFTRPGTGVWAQFAQASTLEARSQVLAPLRTLVASQWARLGEGPPSVARAVLAFEATLLAEASGTTAEVVQWARRGEAAAAGTPLSGHALPWRAFAALDNEVALPAAIEACPGTAQPVLWLSKALAPKLIAPGERRGLVDRALTEARTELRGLDRVRFALSGAQAHATWSLTVTQPMPGVTLAGSGLSTVEAGLGASEGEATPAEGSARLSVEPGNDFERVFSMGLLGEAWRAGIEGDDATLDAALGRLIQAGRHPLDPVVLLPWYEPLPSPRVVEVSPALEPLAWAWIGALAEVRGHAALSAAVFATLQARAPLDARAAAPGEAVCAEASADCRAPRAFLRELKPDQARALARIAARGLTGDAARGAPEPAPAKAGRGSAAKAGPDPLSSWRPAAPVAAGLCAQLIGGGAVDIEAAGRACGRGGAWLEAARARDGETPRERVLLKAQALSVVAHLGADDEVGQVLTRALFAPELREALRAERDAVRAAALDAGQPGLALLIDAVLAAEDIVAGRAPSLRPAAALAEGHRAGVRGHPAMRLFAQALYGTPADARAAAESLLKSL